jgi:hypothetical protein
MIKTASHPSATHVALMPMVADFHLPIHGEIKKSQMQFSVNHGPASRVSLIVIASAWILR